MPLVSWTCALSDGPPVALPVASTVTIAPGDDSIDTNEITVTGTGTITSLGIGPLGVLITKKITFTGAGGAITIAHTPPGLMLLGGVSHTVPSGKSAIGRYQWDGASEWVEQSYTDTSIPPPAALIVEVPAGTVMLFVQATAPTGWTKLTTRDDMGLRIVAGSTGGQAHGSGSFAGTFNPGTHGTTTASANTYTVQPWDSSSASVTINATDTHSHEISIPIAYVDVIQASKD